MSYKPYRGDPKGFPVSIPPEMANPMPVIASTGDEDEEIRLLTEQLQLELGNLSSTHSVLETDMQRLAAMLAPYMTPAGRLNLPESGLLDPKIMLFKQGLDFRISEYNEDCKRMEQVQGRLQRKLEEAAGSYERTFMGVSGLADARIIRRLEELQRVIQVQQHELDQTRFERDVVSDEARRLRQMFIRTGPVNLAHVAARMQQDPFNPASGSLHLATVAKFAPMAGPTNMSSSPVEKKEISPGVPATSAGGPGSSRPSPDQEPSLFGWLSGAPTQSSPSQQMPQQPPRPPAARRDFL